jgi:hypothetical protein
MEWGTRNLKPETWNELKKLNKPKKHYKHIINVTYNPDAEQRSIISNGVNSAVIN